MHHRNITKLLLVGLGLSLPATAQASELAAKAICCLLTYEKKIEMKTEPNNTGGSDKITWHTTSHNRVTYGVRTTPRRVGTQTESEDQACRRNAPESNKQVTKKTTVTITRAEIIDCSDPDFRRGQIELDDLLDDSFFNPYGDDLFGL